MSGLKTDESGQWLLLGAMIVAVGLAVLIVFVNQSVLAGHSSSTSIMDFPKNDIREFRAEVTNEGYLLGKEANSLGTSLSDRQLRFDTNFSRFADDTRYLYTARGADVYLQCVDKGLNYSMLPGGQSIDNVTLYINYNNGDTQYNETVMVFMR